MAEIGTDLEKAIQYLAALKARLGGKSPIYKGLKVYDPVPKAVMRVAGTERAQLVIESGDRRQLQEALEVIDQDLRSQSQGRMSKGENIRWLIERDPISI